MLGSINQTLTHAHGSVLVYSIYLPIIILLTILVGRSLFRSGKFFMQKIFSENEVIAMATNELFKIGFYLLNIGFALVIIKVTFFGNEIGIQRIMEVLSVKIGGFSIYLGFILLLHLFIFLRGTKRATNKKFVTQKS